MTTLPPAGVAKFPEDSLEKQVYNMVDSLKDFLPVDNDRNRLSYCLYKYVQGEGDTPEILLHTQKLTLQNVTDKELIQKLYSGLETIKK